MIPAIVGLVSKVQAAAVSAPSAPTLLSAAENGASQGQFNASWSSVTGATSYTLNWTGIANGSLTGITGTSASNVSTGNNGGDVSVTVQAVNAGGTSAASNAITVNLPAP